MALRFPRLVFPLLLVAPFLLRAQTAPALPPNAEVMLRDLDAMETQRKSLMLTSWRAALAKVSEGAAQGPAAAAMYRTAVEETRFQGKINQSAAYTEWKNTYEEALKSKEMQAVLLLHLKYLELSMKRTDAEKPELFAPPSLAYAQEVAQSDILFLKQEREAEQFKMNKDRGQSITARDKDAQDVGVKVAAFRKELLDKPLTDSVFTKWLRLDQWLPKKDWELVPGNLAGILSKNVRPYLRAAKDPKISDTWIFEMQFLADRVVYGRLQHEAENFDKVTRPVMQFNRANDMIEIGDLKGGAVEIYTLIKTYPQHADFSKWVARLRQVLAPAAAAAPAAPAPVEAEVPATPVSSGTSPQ